MKTTSMVDRQRLADLTNECIAELNPGKYNKPITTADFYKYDSPQYVMTLPNVGITRVFQDLSEDRKPVPAKYYHFKKFKFGLDMLKREKLWVNSCQGMRHIDKEEFEAFLKIVEAKGLYTDPDKLEKKKKSVFVFCFSKNGTDETFWKDFGDNDTGICIEFEYKPVITAAVPEYEYFDFRNVVYDNLSETRFKPISELNSKTEAEFGKRIVFNGLNRFAHLHKRHNNDNGASFTWEDETRLAFDYDIEDYSNYLKSIFPVSRRKGLCKAPEHLNIPFRNPLFELKVTKVICGKNVTHSQMEKVRRVLDDSSIPVNTRP